MVNALSEPSSVSRFVDLLSLLTISPTLPLNECVKDKLVALYFSTIEEQVKELTQAVQTISNTSMNTSTTASLAAAAVDMADKSMGIMDI